MRVNCGTRILFLNGLVCTINLGIVYTICKSSSMVTDKDIDFVSFNRTAGIFRRIDMSIDDDL